ncbi:MAG: hypothetical protein RH980_14335 [Roseovarius confluentis]
MTYPFADTGRSKDDTPSIGCFDRPFLIHIIRDVFVISPIVTVPEFSLKAALVTYMDITNGEDEAQVVAENLTDNARSIMRNKGGLVAARTMYPIPETKWSDPGHVTAPRHSGHHADPSEGPSWA